MRVTISLGSNTASLLALRQLASSGERLSRTFERLASGQRINRASDDAAGLAIASSLRADSRVFAQGMRNINDAQSALSISEGGLSGLSDVAIRIRELATQSANGTFSLAQRRSNDAEADALVAEFNRTVATTSFNGLNLLDRSFGSMRIQGGYGTNGGLAIDLNDALSRNVGSGTFGSVNATTSSIAGLANVVSVDLNNDGILDVVAKNNTNTIVSLLGNGNGTFVEVNTYSGGASGTKIYSADFDRDGKQDILLTNGDTQVGILFGRGDGSFGAQTLITLSSATIAQVGIGDVNGDGIVDIAAMNGSGGANVRLGNGNGTFAAAISSGNGFSGNAFKLADIDRDGRADIIANNASGFSVMYSAGNGSFGSPTNYTSSVHGDFDTGDFNGDGVRDIAVRGGTSVEILLGQDDKTFGPASSLSTSTSTQFQIGDVDNDGNDDIVTLGLATVNILLGNGNGSFESATSKSLFASSSGLALADFNGDSVLDIGTIRSGSVDTYLADKGKSTGLQSLNLSSREDALRTMDTIDALLTRITQELGSIGSFQSRLSSAYNALSARRDNSIAAASRIQDADIAQESAEATRQTILQQAASGVLAQANQQPQLALQLLRG